MSYFLLGAGLLVLNILLDISIFTGDGSPVAWICDGIGVIYVVYGIYRMFKGARNQG